MEENRRTACVVILFLVWAVIGATERFPPLSARFNNKKFCVLIKLIVINVSKYMHTLNDRKMSFVLFFIYMS